MASPDSQAFKTHTTFPSFKEDLKNKAGPTPLSYSISDLTQVLISNASQPVLPKLTAKQRLTVQKWQEDLVYSVEEFKTVLKEACSILNRAFYFGLFKNQVQYEIRTSPAYPTHDIRAQGWFENFWNEDAVKRATRTPQQLYPEKGQKARMVLCLYNTVDNSDGAAFTDNPVTPETFNREQLSLWIGVMVHELLHGFFDIYMCECWRKCHVKATDAVEGIGGAGHGAKWAEAMEAIRDRCRTEFGLKDVTCGIDKSVYNEILRTGWKPTESQIRRWGLDGRMVYDCLKQWDSTSLTHNPKMESDKAVAAWLKWEDEHK